MNLQQYLEHEARFNRSKLKNETDYTRKNTIMERASGDEPLEKDSDQETATTRVHIRFVSVRKRLCDPDNLSVKWLLDCLRYCGAIDGDEPDKITLEVSQRKAVKNEQEHTIIEIIKP